MGQLFIVDERPVVDDAGGAGGNLVESPPLLVCAFKEGTMSAGSTLRTASSSRRASRKRADALRESFHWRSSSSSSSLVTDRMIMDSELVHRNYPSRLSGFI